MEATVEEQLREEYHPADVAVVLFKDGDLLVEVETDASPIVIRAKKPIGYRVLDEGDLIEFWPTCSLANGWLHKILVGGWMELESTREGFLSSDQKELGEWLIVTENTCVSIICHQRPTVQYTT